MSIFIRKEILINKKLKLIFGNVILCFLFLNIYVISRETKSLIHVMELIGLSTMLVFITTQSIGAVARGATRARASLGRRIIAMSQKDAKQSRMRARQVIAGSPGFPSASRQIGVISTTIDDIAFETDLLSLKVSIEAAQAGDSAQNFVVLASEIRALARRSAKAANDIKAIALVAHDQIDQFAGRPAQVARVRASTGIRAPILWAFPSGDDVSTKTIIPVRTLMPASPHDDRKLARRAKPPHIVQDAVVISLPLVRSKMEKSQISPLKSQLAVRSTAFALRKPDPAIVHHAPHVF